MDGFDPNITVIGIGGHLEDEGDFFDIHGKVRLSILPSPYLIPQLGPYLNPYLNAFGKVRHHPLPFHPPLPSFAFLCRCLLAPPASAPCAFIYHRSSTLPPRPRPRLPCLPSSRSLTTPSLSTLPPPQVTAYLKGRADAGKHVPAVVFKTQNPAHLGCRTFESPTDAPPPFPPVRYMYICAWRDA